MYLVTGASGQFGQAAIAHLLADQKIPASQIIAVSRSPEKLSALAAKGVTVRAGSFDDEAGLAAAFAGAKRILLISTDSLTTPGERQRQRVETVGSLLRATCRPFT